MNSINLSTVIVGWAKAPRHKRDPNRDKAMARRNRIFMNGVSLRGLVSFDWWSIARWAPLNITRLARLHGNRLFFGLILRQRVHRDVVRSEERRVGKECR